jgi:hypothetical protein
LWHCLRSHPAAGALSDQPKNPFILYLDLAARAVVDGSFRAAITPLPEYEARAALAVVAVIPSREGPTAQHEETRSQDRATRMKCHAAGMARIEYRGCGMI